MLNHWFYSHATWQVALAVCSFLIIVPLIALFFFHRIVDWESREHDTTMVGLSYALCGGLYAVMLAFVAVGTFETMDKTSAVASSEANSLGSIEFDSAGLPPELGAKVRDDVNRYIDIVVQKEWPNQRAYRMEESNFEDGWAQVRRISVDIADFEPATQGQATVKAEVEHLVNDLFAARRSRLLAASAHLPDAVWEVLLFGLGLVAIYVFLFGPHSYKMHMAVTALTMLSIGLTFTLVIALDYPFRGDVSVDSDSYRGVREVAGRIFSPGEGSRPKISHEKRK